MKHIFILFWPSYLTSKFDFALKIGEGLSKAGIWYGELRHVGREKEHCVHGFKYVFHLIIKGQILIGVIDL